VSVENPQPHEYNNTSQVHLGMLCATTDIVHRII